MSKGTYRYAELEGYFLRIFEVDYGYAIYKISDALHEICPRAKRRILNVNA